MGTSATGLLRQPLCRHGRDTRGSPHDRHHPAPPQTAPLDHAAAVRGEQRARRRRADFRRGRGGTWPSVASPTRCSSRWCIGYVPRLVGRGATSAVRSPSPLAEASAGFVLGVPFRPRWEPRSGGACRLRRARRPGGPDAAARRQAPAAGRARDTRAKSRRRHRPKATRASRLQHVTFLGQFTLYTFISVVPAGPRGRARPSSVRSCCCAAHAAWSACGSRAARWTATRGARTWW